MFCKKCGNEVDGQFCPKCGTEVGNEAISSDGNQNVRLGRKRLSTDTTKQVTKIKVKKPLWKKWWFWVLIVLVIGIIANMSGDDEQTSSQMDDATAKEVGAVQEQDDVEEVQESIPAKDTGDAEASDSTADIESDIKNSDSDISTAKADIYEVLGTIEDIPYDMTNKAKTFIGEHAELFPAQSKDIVQPFVNGEVNYKSVMKNYNNFGDSLLYLDQAQVISIQEENIDEKTIITSLQIVDIELQNHYIYYLGSLPDIYIDDIVTVYGAPLGITSFDNIDGGTTNAIMLAGSYIEKIPDADEI